MQFEREILVNGTVGRWFVGSQEAKAWKDGFDLPVPNGRALSQVFPPSIYVATPQLTYTCLSLSSVATLLSRRIPGADPSNRPHPHCHERGHQHCDIHDHSRIPRIVQHAAPNPYERSNDHHHESY